MREWLWTTLAPCRRLTILFPRCQQAHERGAGGRPWHRARVQSSVVGIAPKRPLCGAALVPMMESADVGFRNHVPHVRRLSRARNRCVLLQAQVRPSPMIFPPANTQLRSTGAGSSSPPERSAGNGTGPGTLTSGRLIIDDARDYLPLFQIDRGFGPYGETVPASDHRHKLPAGYRLAKTPVLGGLHHEYRLVKEAA